MENNENNTQKIPPTSHSRREGHQNMPHLHPGPYPMAPPPPPPAPEYYPMGGYYPYYQAPPVMPPMNYLYMDVLRNLAVERELRGILPKIDRTFDDRDSRDRHGLKDNGEKSIERIYMRKSNKSKKENNRVPSRLCFQCQQHVRCTCCCQPLMHDRPLSAMPPMPCNYHTSAPPPVQVVTIPRCSCDCKKSKTHTKHKSKKVDSRLMPNNNEYPERDTSSIKSTRKTRGASPNTSNNELSSDEWSEASSVVGNQHNVKTIKIKPSQRNCLSEEEGKAEYMRGDELKTKSKKPKLRQRPATAYFLKL